MSEDEAFAQLIQRVRRGDEQAAQDLVRDYDAVVRREVRLRLHDQRLRRLFDSADIGQSVLASFFVRAAVGQFDLQHPAQLVKLLVSMSQKKLASEARRHSRKRRNHRRTGGEGDERLNGIPGDDGTPSQTISYRELIERAQEMLSDEERLLIELRNDGYTWEQVAERLGGTAQARRVQFSRAVARTVRDLGLDQEIP